MRTFNTALKYQFKALIIIILTLFLQACKVPDKTTPHIDRFTDNLYAKTSTLHIQVAYEEEAEPFTSYHSYKSWDVCEQNLNTILSSQSIKVYVPKQLSEMKNFGVLEQNNYTKQNIIDYSAKIQKFTNKDTTKGITILFLNGYYINNGTIDPHILGINLDGTSTLAIFKPVILSSSTSDVERALIEQSTILHEIGHAIGLVNNGVQATSSHHDNAHGAHCTNKNCVMYWQNGGPDIRKFILPFLTSGDIQLFGSQCIYDVLLQK